jgi:cytochrome c oxidase assembly factor CtaG
VLPTATALELGYWSFDPLQLAPVAIAAYAYERRVRTLARRGRMTEAWRRVSFHSGLVLLVVAFVSPVDRIGEERLFSMHMVQHLLLGDLAPLLVVIGLNGPLLRPLLATPGLRWLRHLAHPLVALPVWWINLYVWHLPVLYQATLAHDTIHALEHEMFFWCGAAMWAAVIEPLPGPAWFGTGWKAVYVLVVRTAGSMLGIVFMWSSTLFYPKYAAGERIWGIAPLHDQMLAGELMFTEGAIVTFVVFAWLFLRWMRESEIRQRLIDAGHDPDVAARAARYGRSALARDAAATLR